QPFDDGQERRAGLAVSVDVPRREGRVPRRDEDLSTARRAQYSGEKLLVGGRLRLAEPLGIAERSAVAFGQQLQQAEGQRRWVDRWRMRPERTKRRRQLDQDSARKGLVPVLPLLQPDGGFFRKALGVKRHGGEANASPPGPPGPASTLSG